MKKYSNPFVAETGLRVKRLKDSYDVAKALKSGKYNMVIGGHLVSL